MPRMARVVLPGFPHHVVQRGHNRQVVFAGSGDFERYLCDLRELKDAFGVRVYAYCLMTNHVHLLLTPGDETAGLGRLMKALAARATRYRNRLERRSGTLWESRYKSSLVQTDGYLLACCRYIELNPIRARMVKAPEAYRWSSFGQRMGLDERWIDLDPCYLALGATGSVRRKQYRRFLHDAIPEGEWDHIRSAVQRGQLTGGARFVDEIESILGRRVENRGPGRTRRVEFELDR